MTPRATKKALDAIENPGAHPDVWDLVRRGIETGGRIELVQETENDDEDESTSRDSVGRGRLGVGSDGGADTEIMG